MIRRQFLQTAAALGAATAATTLPAFGQAANQLGLPGSLIAAAQKEGGLNPYEPFPTAQSQPMADSFTAEFGIPNKFFRAGQEALEARLEAEVRAGDVVADTIGESDLDVIADLIDRGIVATDAQPTFWNEYGAQWRYPKLNNVAYAVLSCNMIYNTKSVAPGDAPKTWRDLIAPKWKGQVVIPSPEYAGTGFALLAEWVKRYGWDYVKALKANGTFVVQAVSDSDQRVTSGEKLIGIANSHRASVLLGQGVPFALVWSKETPPVALTYVHGILKKAPHPNAARLYRDYVLTVKVQSAQAKVGLWSANPKATQPANIPRLDQVALVQLDWDDIRKNRAKLIEGWREIMNG